MITKLKQRICWILYCQLGFISVAIAGQNTTSTEYQPPEIHLYKNIAISSVYRNQENPDSFKTKAWSKIIIQQPTLIKSSKATAAISQTTELGQPIWAITIEQLPISRKHCLMSYVDPCIPNASYCYDPCFSSSPEIVAFDEVRGKLYLTVAGSDVGTGGGTYFTFVADINKKEIKFLHNEFGPLEGYLSPSGKYLLINGGGIKVYNTLTDESPFIISKKNIYDPPEKVQLHYFVHIKWLSDTQFTYQDIVAHDKFQNGEDEITEHTVDIPTKKTVYSKTIKANTYQYKPGDELKN